MMLQRRNGDATRQDVDLGDWIATADVRDLGPMLAGPIAEEDPDGQDLLDRVWDEACTLRGHWPEAVGRVEYLWDENDAVSLTRAVAAARPEEYGTHPDQVDMFA